MKKFLIILLILGLIAGGFFGYRFVAAKIEEKRIEEIKKGWYVEIQNPTITIRKEANRNSAELGKVNKGEVYAVFDMQIFGENRWYKIEYKKGKYGWVANPAGTKYLDDPQNPEDIMVPIIRFKNNEYYVDEFANISYDHLEIEDDREGVVITYKVYHEVVESEGKDQYWIKWIATDAAGKKSSKVQKIIFDKRPDEEVVYPFSELKSK